MRHFKREFVGRWRDRELSGIMHSKNGKNSATKENNQEYSSAGYPFNRWMTNDMFFIGSDNLNYVPILTRQN